MKKNFNGKKVFFIAAVICFLRMGVYAQSGLPTAGQYQASYQSLSNYKAPEWYQDAKIGFWVHWGVYSVPAFSGDHAAEWYGRWMYATEENGEKRGLSTHNHHLQTYGDPSVFGYKDFIPMFKAEKFDPNQWANLFVRGGAKFFCMMGAHHDNFAMWNTKLSRFNAVQMGPHRDLVGDIAKAVRARGLKFGVSNHSGWNSGFFQYNIMNHGDATDTANQDLYGNPVIEGKKVSPSVRDLDRWLARTKELCDMYKPDLYYFDWDINGAAFETRRIDFAAHYYNKALAWGDGQYGAPGVVLNYKTKAFPAGAAVLDHERGRENAISPLVWQTDDCVYDGSNWSYVPGVPIKTPNTIIHELADIVSKNGILMLSFGPRADGTFPEDQQQLMLSIGEWLKVNGEAIYKTRPWTKFGEGPYANNTAKEKTYAAEDIRFTRSKDNTVLYAILMDWPKGEIRINSLNSSNTTKNSIKNVSFLGAKSKLKWKLDENGLTIKIPKDKPVYGYAYPLRIQFKGQLPQ